MEYRDHPRSLDFHTARAEGELQMLRKRTERGVGVPEHAVADAVDEAKALLYTIVCRSVTDPQASSEAKERVGQILLELDGLVPHSLEAQRQKFESLLDLHQRI